MKILDWILSIPQQESCKVTIHVNDFISISDNSETLHPLFDSFYTNSNCFIESRHSKESRRIVQIWNNYKRKMELKLKKLAKVL